MERMGRHGARRTVLVIALAAYVAGVGVVAFRHEPWRDEADAWLIARDRSVPELLRLTGHVGMPALPYLLLMPLAKLGLPFGAAQLFHVTAAAAAVALLLWRAPFPLVTRLAIAFSYAVAYEFGVLVRPYALGMLLLFACAALWRARRRRPLAFAGLVALLANATVHTGIIAGAVAAIRCHEGARGREGRRGALALAVMVAGGLAAVAQLVPIGPSQITTWLEPRQPRGAYLALWQLWGNPGGSAAMIPPRLQLAFPPGEGGWTRIDRTGLPFFLAVGAVALAAASWRRHPRVLALFAAAGAGLLYVFVFKWYGGPRHAGLVFLLLVFCAWLQREDARESAPEGVAARRGSRILPLAATGILHAGLLLSVWFAVSAAAWDLRYEYSHGPQMARHLRDTGLVHREIAARGSATAVLVHLPRETRLWFLELGRYATHSSWDATYAAGLVLGTDALIGRAETEFFAPRGLKGPDRLLLLGRPLPVAREGAYELLHRTEGPVGPSDERFYLYRGRSS